MRLLETPTLAFLCSRLTLIFVAGLGLSLVPSLATAVYKRPFPDLPWLDGWARWDAGWYLTVWEGGYYLEPSGPSNLNFPPLFPVLSGLVSLPMQHFLTEPQAFYLAGMIISHCAFLAALQGLHYFGKQLLVDAPATRRAVWLICLFPFSFFFSAAYSESVYLALAVWSLCFAHFGKWGKASFYASLGAIARVQGVLTIVALMAEYLRQQGYQLKAIRRDVWPILLSPLLVLAWLAYEWIQFGPWANVLARERGWGPIGIDRIGEQLRLLLLKGHFLGGSLLDPEVGGALVMWANAFVLVAALGLVLYSFCILPLGLALFSVGSVLMGFFLNGFESFGRYLSVVFPLFLCAGHLLSNRLHFALMVLLFLPFLLLFTYYFAHSYHVV